MFRTSDSLTSAPRAGQPATPWRSGSLVAAIHDVSPRFESAIDRLADRLEHHLGSARFAMLVVPDHWGEAPLTGAPAFAAKLRRWADRGVEIFVHGWFHRDDCAHRGVARLKARSLTAREGEFFGLGRAEASARMVRGRRVIEDIIGRKVAGFIAPAWLYSSGAHEALADNRFSIAEDHFKVWRPETRQVLVRGPVVTWASRSGARAASSIAFAALSRRALAHCETVRVAVHPGDVTRPELMRSVEQTLSHFAAIRSPEGYADLLARSGNGFPQPIPFT